MVTPTASIAIAGMVAGLLNAWTQTLVVKQPSFELSCNTFPPEATEADLIARFGAEHVSSGPVFGFDDGPQQGTILFAQRPEARVEIIWSAAETKRWPALIIVRGPVSRWRTPNGVVVGADLRALERANGRPFRLSGLQMEGGGGGAVFSWAGGRLESPLSGQCRNGVYLQSYDGTAQRKLTRQVTSGREFSSGHPAFQALNPRVVVLTLSFTGARVPEAASLLIEF
jgi:hypothetical protein